MSAGIIGGFAFLGMLGFIFLVFLVLYSRGEVIRLWTHPIACFPRIKSNRPTRIKVTSHVVQTLSDKLIDIFDEAIYESVKEKKLRNKSTKELAESWEKIKVNPKNFTIWCLRFKKRWCIAGERGKLVFAFSLFSLEEMTHQYGRNKLIKAILLHPPLKVHHPIPKKEWINMRINEAKANGSVITPELRKKIEKAYRLTPKESWISLIIRPTMLSTIEEAELVEKSVGFGNLFRIAVNAMRETSTKLANYEVYEHAVSNMLEVKRRMEKLIHELEDDKGHNARVIQQLRHQMKMITVPMRVSPDMEPFPSSIPRADKEEKGSVNEVKKQLKKLDGIEFMLLILILFGVVFTCVGAGIIMGTGKWELLAIGCLLDISGIGLYMLKKRNDPKITLPQKQDDEVTGIAIG